MLTSHLSPVFQIDPLVSGHRRSQRNTMIITVLTRCSLHAKSPAKPDTAYYLVGLVFSPCERTCRVGLGSERWRLA